MTDQIRYIERKIEEFINLRTRDGQPLNRSHLMTEFGYSEIGAANHIKRFNARNPGFLVYDMTRKAYYRSIA